MKSILNFDDVRDLNLKVSDDFETYKIVRTDKITDKYFLGVLESFQRGDISNLKVLKNNLPNEFKFIDAFKLLTSNILNMLPNGNEYILITTISELLIRLITNGAIEIINNKEE